MAERAGILFDTGNFASGMTYKRRTELVQSLELIGREEAAIRQNGVESFDGMSFTLDITISIRAEKRFRTDAKDAVVQDVQDIDTGETTAGVAGISVLDSG